MEILSSPTSSSSSSSEYLQSSEYESDENE